jgi:hypothetical protein
MNQFRHQQRRWPLDSPSFVMNQFRHQQRRWPLDSLSFVMNQFRHQPSRWPLDSRHLKLHPRSTSLRAASTRSARRLRANYSCTLPP